MRGRFVVLELASATAAALLVLALLPPNVQSLAPGGGDIITGDFVLTSSFECSGTGLIIGASGITIDLNGNTISSLDGSGMGIDCTGGHDNVTIKNLCPANLLRPEGRKFNTSILNHLSVPSWRRCIVELVVLRAVYLGEKQVRHTFKGSILQRDITDRRIESRQLSVVKA